MTTTPDPTTVAPRGGPTRPDPQSGPPLLVPVLSFAALTVAGAATAAGAPRPDTSAAAVLAYDQAHPLLLAVAGALLFASSIPLAITAATVYRRFRRLGVAAPGPLMGFAGGLLAAASIAASAIFIWTAGQTAGLGDATLARALTTLSFATGATGFVAPLGLLLAGIAVPALILRLLPRWLALAGLVVGILAMASTFALVTPALYPLLPIGRFGGLLFLVASAALLPRAPRREAAVVDRQPEGRI